MHKIYGIGERWERRGPYSKRAHLRPASLIFDNSIESNSNQSNAAAINLSNHLARDYNNNTSYSSISSWIQYSEFPIMAEVRTA